MTIMLPGLLIHDVPLPDAVNFPARGSRINPVKLRPLRMINQDFVRAVAGGLFDAPYPRYFAG